jgi:hypothetical protein
MQALSSDHLLFSHIYPLKKHLPIYPPHPPKLPTYHIHQPTYTSSIYFYLPTLPSPYPLLVKHLFLSKTLNSFGLNFYFLTKPFYSLVKPLLLNKTFISSWLNLYFSMKLLYFLGKTSFFWLIFFNLAKPFLTWQNHIQM